MIEMKDIEYVKAIHDYRTLTRAAEHLKITQPSLSMYIKNLEERYQFQIFDHIGKRLSLTYLGEVFLKYGTEILQYRDNLEDILQAVEDENYGRVRVGIPLIRGSYLMPVILPAFEKIYPNVEIVLVEESSSILEDRLLNGDCDIIIVNMSNHNKLLEYHSITQEEILLALPHNHPAIQTAKPNPNSDYPLIDIHQFADERFILCTNDLKIGEETQVLFRALQFNPSRRIETNNIQTALNLTIEGYGVSLIYENHFRHLATESDTKPQLFSVSDPSIKSEVILAYRKNVPIPQYFRDFIRISKEVLSVDFNVKE